MSDIFAPPTGVTTPDENLIDINNGIKNAIELMGKNTKALLKDIDDKNKINNKLLKQAQKEIDTKDITKKTPTLNDVAKTGDMGAILIAKILQSGQKAREETKGLFSGVFEKLGITKGLAGLKGLAATALKAAPIVALIGGLVWGAIDAVKAVFLADKWKTSKVSAGIAGFIAGTGSGWKNAFKNAGKWALIGVGTGFLIGGPIGAIAGGLIGGAIGMILGYFGGEKIAKFFDKIGAFFKNAFEKVKEAIMKIWNNPLFKAIREFFGEALKSYFEYLLSPFKAMWNAVKGIVDKLKAIWGDKNESFLKKLGRTFITLITAWPKIVIAGVKGLIQGIINLFLDVFVGKKDKEGKRTKKSLLKMFGDLMIRMGKGIIEALGNIFKDIGKAIKNLPSLIGDATKWAYDKIIVPILDFIKGMFSEAVNIVVDTGVWLKEHVIAPVGQFFGKIGTAIYNEADKVWKAVSGFVQTYLIDPVKSVFDKIGGGIRSLFEKAGLLKSEEEILMEQRAEDEARKKAYVESLTERELIQRQLDLESKKLESAKSYERPDIERRIADLETQLNKFSPTSVKDAIIKPDGKIIKTDPKDTIIATKNTPNVADELVAKLKNIKPEIETPTPPKIIMPTPYMAENSKIEESRLKLQEQANIENSSLISLLKELLIQTTKNKSAAVVQNNNYAGLNFENLKAIPQ